MLFFRFLFERAVHVYELLCFHSASLGFFHISLNIKIASVSDQCSNITNSLL